MVRCERLIGNGGLLYWGKGHEVVIYCSLTARLSHGNGTRESSGGSTCQHSGTKFVPTNLMAIMLYQGCFLARPYFNLRYGVVVFEDDQMFRRVKLYLESTSHI